VNDNDRPIDEVLDCVLPWRHLYDQISDGQTQLTTTDHSLVLSYTSPWHFHHSTNHSYNSAVCIQPSISLILHSIAYSCSLNIKMAKPITKIVPKCLRSYDRHLSGKLCILITMGHRLGTVPSSPSLDLLVGSIDKLYYNDLGWSLKLQHWTSFQS